MFSSPSSSLLLNTVLDKFQALIQSRYSSAVVATSLVIGIPLLRDFYRSETKPSMEKTILEVYDALLADLLEEHCKNVNKKRKMNTEAVIQNNYKRQDEKFLNDNDDDDDDYSEENTLSELDEEVCYCVAVPLDFEMDCLAKLIEVVDEKEERLGEEDKEEQSTQRILSGIRAVVVDTKQEEEIYFDVAATIHCITNGKNRSRHNYLLLSPEFIETIDENALTGVVSLAIGYLLSSNDAHGNNVHHRSVIRDLISIFILVTHFQANSFLAGVIDEKYVQQFEEDENDDDEGKSSFNGMTDHSTIAKEVITDIFEDPSSFGHTQMIGFLSSIRHFLEETSSLSLFSSKDDGHSVNCFLILPNLIDNNHDLKIDFNFLCDPETEALCTTQFHQTLIRTHEPGVERSPLLSFPCAQFIKSIKRDLKFTFTRSLHDFIPLFGKYGQVRKALRWIPFAAVAFQLGSTFFFTAVSKMEQFGDDLTSSSSSSNHDHHHENENKNENNNNNEDDDLFSQICSLALSSTWLQQTVMTFGHGWVQYSTDSTMASRWFLLAMTSDYETFTDVNNINKTKTPLMSSPCFSPKQQQPNHHHHHQPIDGALAAVAKTLESVPGLLTSLDSALYLPTNNLVGLVMMIAAGIPSELLFSNSDVGNNTQLHHHGHSNNPRVLTSLFKTTLLFSIFVTLKRIYGFVYDQHCMDTTTLHFSMTIRKRIQARAEARMTNMIKRLQVQEEESSPRSSSSLLMISVDPYVNTASIFCNARESSSYHGNDGFEECLDYRRKSSSRLMINGNKKNKRTMKSASKNQTEPSLEEFMSLMRDDDNDDDDEFSEVDQQQAENNEQEEDGLNDKESPSFFTPTTTPSIEYFDDDDEDCFWWSLPEPISNLYSDFCEARRRRRTPTLGLALLASACSYSSSPVESPIPALDFIVGKTSEQSRPPSHLVIRWPSTPLHINKFFDEVIADYHKEYLHPLHVSMREIIEEIIINKPSLEIMTSNKESKNNSTNDENKKITAVDSSNLFFCKSSIVCGGNHNHKPSFETLQSLFETDRFRALRAAGYEVEAAMPSATKFVVQLESHIDHPFSCSSFGGGSGGGGILSSQKLGHDLCEALEEGVLEFLTNYFADTVSNDEKSSSSPHPLKLSAQDVDRLKAMNVSSDSLSLSKGGSVVSSWFEQGFAAGTSELFDLKKKQMENIAAVEVDHTLAKLCLSSTKTETKHQKSEIDQDFEMLERMKECSDRNKNDEQEISELLKSELHRSRNIDCCFPSSSSQSVPTPLHTSFEKNILFVSSSSSNSSWTWTFQNVSFAYPSNPDKLVLKDISFSISSKTTKSVGICAESGTGKSTLFLLMLKIYLPTQGRILLNDVDLREVPPRWLRRHIAYVGPACKLFKGATARGQVLTANPLIRENAPLLLSSSSSASSQTYTHQATQALKEAQVPARMYLRPSTSFNSSSSSSIPPFPTAASMSGGEQQRVQIARAFGKMIMARQENSTNNNDTNSNINIRNSNDNRVIALLFDEGTSALDAKTEEEIVRAIEGECGGESEINELFKRENNRGVLTIPRFVISHRLFTIRDCDHILILHKHRLVSQGSFSECVDRARTMSETTKATAIRVSALEKQQLAGEMWFNEVVQRQMLKGEATQKEDEEEEEEDFLEEAEED